MYNNNNNYYKIYITDVAVSNDVYTTTSTCDGVDTSTTKDTGLLNLIPLLI